MVRILVRIDGRIFLLNSEKINDEKALIIQLLMYTIVKFSQKYFTNPATCMTASMRSEMSAKTISSQMLHIFKRVHITSQVSDSSSTGYQFPSTDLYGESVWGMLGDSRFMPPDAESGKLGMRLKY